MILNMATRFAPYCLPGQQLSSEVSIYSKM